MTTVSPPKPWERGAHTGAAAATAPSIPSTTTTAAPSSISAPSAFLSDPPSLPNRPDSISSVVNSTAASYSPYGQSRLNQSPYSTGYGGYNNYSSPYSRFGGMNSMYGGGGGYGSMYGGMGGMYGGGYGMGGIQGGQQDPNSLTNSFNQSTQATFQIIESIVGAFGGFAQMLESTYMATHSSFFAMVSVAEQFGTLRNTLGSMLGIFTILRWLRTLLAKITGRPPPADATSLTPHAFAHFMSGKKGSVLPERLPDGSPAPPRPSKKPFIMFAIAVFGLPYLMGKLIRALARSQEEEAARQQAQSGMLSVAGADGQREQIDPKNLDFCRLLYDYTPSTQSAGIDLPVKKGDLVAILSKTDPMGNPSEWWRCRSRDGKVGYLPSPYLELIHKRTQQQGMITSGSAPGSRTHTLTSSMSDSGRTKSLSSVKVTRFDDTGAGPKVEGKPGDISAESFQKSAFYS